MTPPDRSITLTASKVAGVLACMAICLVFAGTATQLVKFATGHGSLYGLVRVFDLNQEHNVPTFFSASLLLLAFVLVGLVAVFKRQDADRFSRHWAILALLFLFLAFDEAASIHELCGRPVRELCGGWARGAFYFAWVVPGMVLVLLLAVAYLKFWLHLPPRTRGLVFVAGALYLGGAVGLELVGGRHAEQHGRSDATFAAITTVEESLEMAGVIMFVFAMLRYIESRFGTVRIRFTSPAQRRNAECRTTFESPALELAGEVAGG
jgi:hypothetical protein